MKRRRRRKIKLRGILGAVLFAVIIALLLNAIDKTVRPTVRMQTEAVARQAANIAVAEAVSRYIEETECSYSDFAAVLYDESGRAASVEALSRNINRLQSELSLELSRSLSESRAAAEVPIGTLSGSYLLAGKGPSVKVRVCSAGTVDVKLKSTFDTAGINQTRHRIFAEISTDMTSSTMLYSFDTHADFEYLLAETVIVGDVPEYSVKAWSG